MKTILLCFMIFSAALMISCEREGSFFARPLSALGVDIPDSIALGQECDYTIHGMLPNPCHWYFRKDQSSHANNIDITVYIKEDPKKYCPQVVVPIDIPGHFNFAQRGIYFMHFWRSDTETLDKTVTVY